VNLGLGGAIVGLRGDALPMSRPERKRSATTVVAACVIAVGLAAPCAVADEIGVRAAIKAEAARLLEQGDLARFDQRATELRHSRARTPAGIWRLSLFYRGVDDLPTQRPDSPIWATVESAAETYLRSHPESPSAVVTYARVLASHAWAWRGDGYGRDLSEAQQKGFDRYLEDARAVLDAHRAVGAKDPEWYSIRIEIMNGSGVDKPAIMALADEALSVEPTYQPIHYVASHAFLPKWGGTAQLLQQYVALALAKSSAEEGTQAYARIMFNISRWDPQPVAALTGVGADWPRLKASLEEIAKAYPDPWNLNAERAMACLLGNEHDFDEISQRVGPDSISVVWYDTIRRWPDCEHWWRKERQSTPSGFLASFLNATPSPYLFGTVAAAVLAALAILSLSRRRRAAASGPWAGLPTSAPMGADGSSCPRVYPITPAWQALQVLAGVILLLPGLVGTWTFGAVFAHESAGLAIAFFAALLAAVGVMTIIDALETKLVLFPDTLEVHELWGTRRLRRADIAARRKVQRTAPARLELLMKGDKPRSIKLALPYSLDTRFDAWFNSIPDADVVAAAAIEAEVRNDLALGSTPEERLARFALAKQRARYLGLAVSGLCLWSYLYPRPYALNVSLLAALPWVCIALVASRPGIFQLGGSQAGDKVRPDLAAAFMAPAALLGLRAFMDVHVVDWHELVPWAAGMAALLLFALIRVDPSASRRWATLMFVLVAGVYGFGASSLGNALLDRSSPDVYPTKVLGKHVSSGRNRTYELRLAPWGQNAGPRDVTVSRSLFGEVEVGQTVCVNVHAGAIRVAWYSVNKCDGGETVS
jgi:hypothetical protein